MDLQEIEIVINKKGEVEIHVRGVKGEACLALTHELEQALGGKIILRDMTSEALDQPNPLDDTLTIRGS